MNSCRSRGGQWQEQPRPCWAFLRGQVAEVADRRQLLRWELVALGPEMIRLRRAACLLHDDGDDAAAPLCPATELGSRFGEKCPQQPMPQQHRVFPDSHEVVLQPTVRANDEPELKAVVALPRNMQVAVAPEVFRSRPLMDFSCA